MGLPMMNDKTNIVLCDSLHGLKAGFKVPVIQMKSKHINCAYNTQKLSVISFHS